MTLSIVQQQYLDRVREGKTFGFRGQSLFCHGQEFPMAMAKTLQVKPKSIRYIANGDLPEGLDEKKEFEKAWAKA